MSKRFSTRSPAPSPALSRSLPDPLRRLLAFGTLILALTVALATSGAALAQDDSESPDPTQTTAEAPFELRTVAEGMVSPVLLTSPPDDSRRFVVDRPGQIYILQEDGTMLEQPFLDIDERVVELRDSFDERGLLGLAFHPNYAENGRYYVHYSAPLREEAPDDWDHTTRISEFKATQPEEGMRSESDTTDMNSERILLEIDQPQFNHNAGAIAFGPDGYLYIPLGDGGAANDVALGHPPMGHGQDVTSMLGNILRIDVDRGWPGYAIPRDNPFVGQDAGGHNEIYAWGWRNPYKMSFDSAGNGDMYVATNGQNLWEAVYLVDEPGNYGWNILEGTHCFDPQNPNTPPEECASEGPEGRDLQLPVIEYPHPRNQGDSPVAGISVIGGHVYRGSDIPELQGQYVFGDWSLSFSEPQGQIFTATPNDSENATAEGDLWPMDKVMQLDHFVLGFGEDSNGELYVLTTDNTGPTGETGMVHMLVPVGEGDAAMSGDGSANGSGDGSDDGSEEGDGSN